MEKWRKEEEAEEAAGGEGSEAGETKNYILWIFHGYTGKVQSEPINQKWRWKVLRVTLLLREGSVEEDL